MCTFFELNITGLTKETTTHSQTHSTLITYEISYLTAFVFTTQTLEFITKVQYRRNQIFASYGWFNIAKIEYNSDETTRNSSYFQGNFYENTLNCKNDEVKDVTLKNNQHLCYYSATSCINNDKQWEFRIFQLNSSDSNNKFFRQWNRFAFKLNRSISFHCLIFRL